MAAKNTKKNTKTPLKKSAVKRVHGGADDGSSGVGSVGTADISPPILIHKPLGSSLGSEVTPLGATGASSGSRR